MYRTLFVYLGSYYAEAIDSSAEPSTARLPPMPNRLVAQNVPNSHPRAIPLSMWFARILNPKPRKNEETDQDRETGPA